jgi:hypothetical protein
MQQSLRSGKDILDTGGHVTPKLSEKVGDMDVLGGPDTRFCNTAPHLNLDSALDYRLFSQLSKNKYASNTGNPILNSSIKNYLELAVRQFIRGVTQNQFNQDLTFARYSHFIEFLKELDFHINVNETARSYLNTI